MPTCSYRWLLFTLAVFGFAADQASKYGMFNWLYTPGSSSGSGTWSPARSCSWSSTTRCTGERLPAGEVERPGPPAG